MMISMRKALAAPGLLWQWFPTTTPTREIDPKHFEVPWSEAIAHGGGAALSWVYGRRGYGVMTSWKTAHEARSAWEHWIQTPHWRACAGSWARQPTVAYLSEQDVAWGPLREGKREILLMWTREASIKTRDDRTTKARPDQRLVTRDALPSLPRGVVCWPTIGHPGRLFVRMPHDQQDSAVRALEDLWGPAVEAPTVWDLRSM